MKYRIGDQVVHWTFGAGQITGIEEKRLAGRTSQYYVWESGRTTLWVPVGEAGEKNLRPPLNRPEFLALLDVLRCPGEQMPEYPRQRQIELKQRMQRRTLLEICLVIRDLATRSLGHRLNSNDFVTFKRAKSFFLDEWERSLGTPRLEAERELESLLRGKRIIEKSPGDQ